MPHKLVVGTFRRKTPRDPFKGGSLVGYVVATYEQLRRQLGPFMRSETDGGYKVKVAWGLIDTETDRGAHLYSYDGESPHRTGRVYLWHIGSSHEETGEKLGRALEKALGAGATYRTHEEQLAIWKKEIDARRAEWDRNKGAAGGKGGAGGKGASMGNDRYLERRYDTDGFHSDVQFHLEHKGWHRDDVIAVTNRDSVAREIHRLRMRGYSADDVAARLHKEMQKTFGKPGVGRPTRPGYARGKAVEATKPRALDTCINYEKNPLGDCGGRMLRKGNRWYCETCFNRSREQATKYRLSRPVRTGRAGGWLGKGAPADGINIGDTLVYTKPHPSYRGREFRGRVVMRGPHGWVVNVGRSNPDVVDDARIVRVIKARR